MGLPFPAGALPASPYPEQHYAHRSHPFPPFGSTVGPILCCPEAPREVLPLCASSSSGIKSRDQSPATPSINTKRAQAGSMQKCFYWIQKHSSIVKKMTSLLMELVWAKTRDLLLSAPVLPWAICSPPITPGLCWWLHPQRLVQVVGLQG